MKTVSEVELDNGDIIVENEHGLSWLVTKVPGDTNLHRVIFNYERLALSTKEDAIVIACAFAHKFKEAKVEAVSYTHLTLPTIYSV